MWSELTQHQWLFALLGAAFIGLGKGGLSGLGNLSIWLMAEAFGARASVGIALPVLICADIVAVLVYRRHADWSHLLRLLPILLLGVVVGYFLFDAIPADRFGMMMGILMLGLTAMHLLRRFVSQKQEPAQQQVLTSRWVLWLTGLLGGVATMLANAAGPIISFYLLAARLPKYAFIGTGAWLYLIINLAKTPFQAAVDNMDGQTLQISLCLGLVAAAFTLLAPFIVRFIPQKLFEALIWIAVVFASLRLIF